MPTVRLSNVEKAWGSRRVLAGVDLEVQPQTTVWIGGANGAGKTTLMRIAGGLVDADAGEVHVGPGTASERRRGIGWLPPGDRGLYARLSPRANLELAAGLAGRSTPQARETAADALARWELTAEADRRVDRLSMGQRQRVRIAAALLHDPAIVLLDEPHTSLDQQGLDLLQADLDRRLTAGACVVWCSPPLDRDRLPADRRLLLEHGVLVTE